MSNQIVSRYTEIQHMLDDSAHVQANINTYNIFIYSIYLCNYQSLQNFLYCNWHVCGTHKWYIRKYAEQCHLHVLLNKLCQSANTKLRMTKKACNLCPVFYAKRPVSTIRDLLSIVQYEYPGIFVQLWSLILTTIGGLPVCIIVCQGITNCSRRTPIRIITCNITLTGD